MTAELLKAVPLLNSSTRTADKGASRQPAHTKVTRDDWIVVALAALQHTPIDKLKVLSLATALDVSRSSFYWYFAERGDLVDELLRLWVQNTESIIDRSTRPAPTITAACLGIFECWADESLFDSTLDMAVRDWGRRDSKIASRVSESDRERQQALMAMFSQHGFSQTESLVRARLLYHSQVGYYAVGTEETMATRISYVPDYLRAMTGQDPSQMELDDFGEFLTTLAHNDQSSTN